MLRIALVFLLASLVAGAAFGDAHERMMKATFKIVGDSKKVEGSEESAAAFAVALGNGRNGGPSRKIALVTAAHFFDNVEGDRIDLIGRRQYSGEEYERVTYPIALRGETDVVVRHPDPNVDAAAILLDWPARFDVTPLTLEHFATSDTLSTAFNVGRAVFALGYPFAIESSEGGFPILRNGYIASYPPPRRGNQRTFLLDLSMSQGYSGAPVYIPEFRGGKYDYSGPLLLGMIVGQHELTSEFNGPFEHRTVRYPLNLAIVVHGPALRKLIESLPQP